MATFIVKNCDETFSLDQNNAEDSFRYAGYDFTECEKDYVNWKYTAWDIVLNGYDGLDIDRIFVKDIIDGRNPDFKPIDGDRNARTYLKMRQYFPDTCADEEEDYWVASCEDDFIAVLKTVDLSVSAFREDSIQFSGVIDGLHIEMVMDSLPKGVALWFKRAVKDKSESDFHNVFSTMHDLDPSRSYDCFIMFDVGD